MSEARTWLYFGCHQQAGHYFWEPGMRRFYHHIASRGIESIDGVLCPRGPEKPYIAAFSRLGGWGYSALSFWDYTVDRRPKSNSNFLAPSLTIAPAELLAQSRLVFPEVWARLPTIRLLEGEAA
jgi:hypothetical protein